MLQFPSVKAVLLSLETFPFVLGPGGSICVPGRKVQKVWIVKNGKYCTTPYFIEEARILKNTVIWTVTGALQLKLSSPACLFTARTATHPPTCLVHCYLASRVYNGPDHLHLHTEQHKTLWREITTYSTYGLFDLFRSGSASVFLSVYFICLTREHLFMQTNKLKEILVYESVLYY